MCIFSLQLLVRLLCLWLLCGLANAGNLPVRLRDQRHAAGRAFPNFFQMIISILGNMHHTA